MNKLYWQIPSSIDLEGFLRKHPPGFPYKIDHFYYIIDYLCRGMEREDLDEIAGYVNLNAARLQKVNHNYKKYLDHLVKHRFLRTDMKYVVGKKSKGFLINRYREYKASIRLVEIKVLVVHRHVLEERKAQNELNDNTRKHYPHLTKWFEGLEIDREGALKKLNEIFPEQTGSIRGTRKWKASDWAKRYRSVQAIEKIMRKEFYFTLDTNVGRFHSNLTNLKKELRGFVTYLGQRLVNVDIKNSQPLLSTLLLKKPSYQTNLLETLCHSTYSFSTPISYKSYTIKIVKTLERIDKQDIEKYIQFVETGDFYGEMHQLMYPEQPYDKQKVKTMMFMIFFSHNRYMGQPKAEPKRRFKRYFPSTYEIFRLLKKRDYTALSRILQRLESTIVIQNVVPTIALEKPDLPIFTIHDSVVTTVGNEQFVANVMIEEVKRLTGLEAKLGFEYW